MTAKTKILFGTFSLLMWFSLVWLNLPYILSIPSLTMAEINQTETEQIILPLLAAFLALIFLVLGYYLLIKKSRKWIKISFLVGLIAPTTVLLGHSIYVCSRAIAAPHSKTTITKQINLRLSVDALNRPVFFFSDYQIKNGFSYDPYEKHILKYPEEVLNLSKTGKQVTGTIVIEYTYNKATRFWLTHLGENTVVTNKIDGSFIPPQFKSLENTK